MIEPKSTDFEEAIGRTGYGPYNLLLMLIALPCCIGSIYEPAITAFIIPSAECDLELSLVAKGCLNAACYAGMIASSMPWGYAADVFGRRKLLIYGLFAGSVCMLFSGLAQNAWQLMLFKFIGGFITCGPFAVLMVYFSEFHGTKHRSNVTMFLGMSFCFGSITLPIIGWLVIPSQWTFVIGESFIIRSWQLFLMVCALPSFIGSLSVMVLLPESPKFLMSQGRNDEALQVMQTIFRWNTGKQRSEFPINSLVDNQLPLHAKDTENHNTLTNHPNGILQILPLLRKPLLAKFSLVVILNLCLLCSLNTMRMWLPQLYAMVSNFEVIDSITDFQYEQNLCGMIAYSVNLSIANMESIATDGFCEITEIKSTIYINAIYSGLLGFFGYIVVGYVLNRFETKNVLVVGLVIVSCSGFGLIWATNTLTTVILSSVYVSLTAILSIFLIGVMVNMFPTALRTFSISVSMMFGRLGSLVGNVLFPYLLTMGCVPPFFFLGGISLLCSLMCLALPRTRNVALK